MGEMDAILRTIREVEESLDRRAARAEGVNVIIWGVVGFAIFAFYQLVELNHDLYYEALGGLISWVWILPMAVGGAASMLVGARLGRLGVEPERRLALRRSIVPALLIAALVTALVLTQRYSMIYGGVTLLGGTAVLIHSGISRHGRMRVVGLAIGSATCAVGIALLAWTTEFAAGIAALTFLLCYGALGTVIYARGR